MMMTNGTSARPPLVGVIMGSQSDWSTMQHAAQMLEQFGVPRSGRRRGCSNTR